MIKRKSKKKAAKKPLLILQKSFSMDSKTEKKVKQICKYHQVKFPAAVRMCINEFKL